LPIPLFDNRPEGGDVGGGGAAAAAHHAHVGLEQLGCFA
jgi:hypothetical protein